MVFVAIRSELVQLGLRELLRSLDGVELIGAANEPERAAQVLAEVRPDVVLVDDEHFAELRKLPGGRTRLLLLTSRRHLGISHEACDRLCGMVGLYAPRSHLLACLHTILHCHSRQLGGGWCLACPLRSTLIRPSLPLSERESEVFEHIGRGERPAEIAQQFGLSVKTVETHRENIKRKLGLGTSMELADAAMRWCRGEYEAPGSSAVP